MASLGLDKYAWYVQLTIWLLLAAVGVGAFYYLYEADKQQQLSSSRVQLDALLAKNEKGSETARQLPAFRAQIAELQARLDALKPILPEEKDVGDLLRRIQTLATQSSLRIRGFRPQPISTREIHAEWPIGLELEGNFHNLGAFLDRVSKFPRIINVGNLVITPHDDATPATSIQVSCTATTFVLVDQAVAPAAPTKKGAPAKKAAPAQKTE